ncbi:MAG: cadherin domain-containing protein [Gammaproteobacteria bacterium]|nr:cadherin domain-containing protein [Gammaproteobacteria bacterium]
MKKTPVYFCVAAAMGLVGYNALNTAATTGMPEILAAKQVKKEAKAAQRAEAKARQAAQPGQRYDQPAAAQAHYVEKRAPAGMKALPMERYAKARAAVSAMARFDLVGERQLPSKAAGAAKLAGKTEAQGWTALGPGNVGGRTRALIIDPAAPNTMYAGAAAGGVWKTADAGASWAPLGDELANMAVASLVMAKDGKTLYAGTGEGVYNGDAVRGAGVFKSADGGLSWSQLGGTASSDFHYVNKLALSTKDEQRLYAATRKGLFRSQDGGVSWTQTSTEADCLSLVGDFRGDSDVLYAACGTFFGNAKILKSADNGATWSVLYTQPDMGRTTLAIAPSNPDVLYALVADYDSDGLWAVLRTGDAGQTWEKRASKDDSNGLNRALLSNTVYANLSACGWGDDQFYNQGWYDQSLAVDPLDADKVWVGGIDLFRSDDGGRNFGMASHWWVQSDGLPSYNHADQHLLVFHPAYNGESNKILFTGNDGGLHLTRDARAPVQTAADAPCLPGQGEVAWESLNNGYGVTQFYHGVPRPDGKSYLGGTQDNGTNLGSDAGGANAWTEIYGGDGGYVAVDPNNPEVLFAEYTNLSIVKSMDGGQNFADAVAGIAEPAGNFQFINPFLMDPNNGQILWTGGQTLWRSIDQAASWGAASAKLLDKRANGRKEVFSAHAVAAGDSNRVLSGTNDGRVFRNSNALAAGAATVWESVYPLPVIEGKQQVGYVSWLAFDPQDKNTAYATYSTFGVGHVWKTTDGGASWSNISGNLPDMPVHSLIVDPADSKRLVLGTDLGLFYSVNGGQSWLADGNGFPHTVVESLSLNREDGQNMLYAFTHGRGAFRIPLSAINKAPAVSIGNGVASIAENSAAGAAVVQVEATDAEGEALSYRLSGSEAFSIDAAGQIRVAAPLDYEGTASYSLVITVGDARGAETEAPLTLNLTNVNEVPVLNPAEASVMMEENKPAGTALASLAASDPDAGDTLSWSISAGNDAGNFAISATTGALSLAKPLDYEAARSHALAVEVRDAGGLKAHGQVDVTVQNVNELPVFNPVTGPSLAESATIGSVVATVAARDPDGDTLSYTLSGGDGLFTIDAASGAIKLAKALDYETKTSHALSVKASDGKGGESSQSVTVSVTDVKESSGGGGSVGWLGSLLGLLALRRRKV